MDDSLMLRAFQEEDLEFLDRLDTDPAALGGFEWFGFGDVRSRRPRWEKDGWIGPDSTALAVVSADGTVIGITSWKAVHRGGSPGVCFEIGIALLPEYRGRGLGTAAQRLLVDYLFRFTTVHRLEAGTTPTTSLSRRRWNASGWSGRACCARWPSETALGETV
jgi:[ribosomal protein S5]-alanine N-acetyltransferase